MDLLTVRQVADLLKVSRQTVYAWIEAGTLRAYRIDSGPITGTKPGATLRIDRADVTALLVPTDAAN